MKFAGAVRYISMAAALLPLQQALAQDSIATFFQDCNYGGSAVSLAEGRYDAAALAARGIRDNDLSSLHVFNGYKVTLYAGPDLTGNSVSYTQRHACLVDDGLNDVVSSVKIEKIDVATSSNPIFPGWYADPEARVFAGRYWIYPTYSAPYDKQTYLDVFSSPDLMHWTKHPKALDGSAVSWARRALWAPSAVEKDGKYYLFFSANDIQNDSESGGIGVAVSDQPGGPFVDLLGKPLIDKFHNGAQPIDQFVFKDGDGQYYMLYGGHSHCNIVKLNDTFTGIVPHADGTLYKEITPQNYVEGAFMFVRNGKYYFMWSEGFWGGPDYSVAYAIADKPTGPFRRIGKVLQQDPAIAKGAGHHSVIKVPGEDIWYIVYHRRPLDQTDGNAREVAIERMQFDAEGNIMPVLMTNTGVPAQTLQYTGLRAEYFNGLNFDTPITSRIDSAVDFHWGFGSPAAGVNADQFSVRWRGRIVPGYSENYTFYLNSDNGRRLWIDNTLVIDRWVDDWGTEYKGSIALQAGRSYDIRVEYFENQGAAFSRLEWASPSQRRAIVDRLKP
ncbi:MAG TPA: family 43 glycosylhydrolase [Telluria sp.]|jgi:hypothetical protein